jgi:hypothetical protein
VSPRSTTVKSPLDFLGDSRAVDDFDVVDWLLRASIGAREDVEPHAFNNNRQTGIIK